MSTSDAIAANIWWLAPSIVTALTSVLVAVAVYAAGRKQSKIQTTLDVHKEYFLPSFGEARSKAIKFFKYHYKCDWSECEPYEVDNPEDMRSGYSEVVRFFYRLAVLASRKRVDRKLTSDLFAHELGWWFGIAFQPMQARKSWWSKDLINALADQLKRGRGGLLFREGFQAGSQEREGVPLSSKMRKGRSASFRAKLERRLMIVGRVTRVSAPALSNVPRAFKPSLV